MASDWIDCQLKDLCSAVNYGLTASASSETAGPRFLRITDIVSGSIAWNSVPGVDSPQQVTAKYQLHHGDIVIARTGASTGESAYIKSPPDAVFASYLVRLKVKPEFDSRFVSYCLRSEVFWSYIRGVLGDKSAQPNASASTIVKVPLRVPRERQAQEEIAALLGAFDDRIEVVRQQNETLEAMARAIFKSWFVDFDPVRAKAEGREPEGMDAATAALFPSEFQDSEIGPIPRGWRSGCIADICRRRTENVIVRELQGAEAYVGLEHISPRNWCLSQWDDASKVASNKSRFSKRDILFGKLRPYFHKVSAAPVDGVCSTDVLVLQPSSNDFYSFLLNHVSSDELIAYATRLSNGAKMPRTSWNDIAAYKIPLPKAALLKAFNELTSVSIDQIVHSVGHLQTLAELRDTLLPRLISRRLRVPEAEATLAEVG